MSGLLRSAGSGYGRGMASSSDRETPDFAVVRHGFDRAQVARHLERLEERARRSATERDEVKAQAAELEGQLQLARREIDALAERLDKITAEGGEDTDRALHIARTQAAEITTRAQAAAETVWTAAEDASTTLGEHYRRLLADLDRQHQQIHAEHKSFMDAARAKAAQMTTAADKRRAELDERAEQERKQIQRQFEADLAAKREELERELAAERSRAEEEAERMRREARDEADKMVATATSQVERLTALREQLAGRLRETADLLDRSTELLRPLQGEAELAPDSPAELTS